MPAKRAFIFYLPEDSPFLKTTALSKLLLVAAISFAALAILDFTINLLILIFTVVLMFTAKVPLKNLGNWLYGFTFMLTFLTSIYILLSKIPGETIYFTFPWGTYLTENTVPRALSVVFRIWSMIFAALIFLSTTTDTDIIASMAKIRIPYTFSFMISLALRSIQMFVEDWRAIIDAYYSRGADVNRGSIIKKLRNYVSLFVPILVITINKVREIDYAAESRGFRLGIRKRSYIDTFNWSKYDTALVLISLVLILSGVYIIFQ